MEEQTHGALVLAARDGSREAWAELVDRFSPMVLAVIRRHRLSDADVDDAFQMTWIKLSEHLDRIREPERVPGWLATTARHEAYRLLRRKTADPFDIDLAADEAESPEHLTAERETQESVAQAMAQLTERCRRLLQLLFVQDLSYNEVSAELAMPVGSIGPIRQRCLASLRKFVDASALEPT